MVGPRLWLGHHPVVQKEDLEKRHGRPAYLRQGFTLHEFCLPQADEPATLSDPGAGPMGKLIEQCDLRVDIKSLLQ